MADTIKAVAPDGTEVHFPANTPMEVINSVMANQFGAEAQGKTVEQAPVGVGEDVAKSFGVGVGKGAIGLGTLPGNLEAGMRSLYNWGVNKVASKLPEGMRPEPPEAVSKRYFDLTGASPSATAGDVQKKVEEYTGEFYKPQTTPGKYAEAIGENTPGALFPGTLAQRVGMNVLAPAIGGELAAQAAEGTGYENAARFGGSIVAPLAVSAATRLAAPITPKSAEHTRQAGILRREGVDITAGQETGNNILRYAEGTLGDMPLAGNSSTAIQQRQGEQFTRAAMRRVGSDADRATNEAMRQSFARIGGVFDDLAARNEMTMDLNLFNDLNRVHADYVGLVPPQFRAPLVDRILNDMQPAAAQVSAGNTVRTSGAQYQNWRSQIDRAARDATDPATQRALYGIRNALDDAMERGMSGADVGAWRNARREYRNILNIENAVTGAGENAASGIISPAQLRVSIRNQDKRGYATGRGNPEENFNELARAGVAVMTPLPNSGTPARAATIGIPAAIAGQVMSGDPLVGAGAGIAAAAAPGIAGRMLMSDTGQTWLAGRTPGIGPAAQEFRAQTSVPAATVSQLPQDAANAAMDDKRLSLNKTFQFLTESGVDPKIAQEALRSPQLMQQLLLQISGGRQQ